ncbi:MAG: homoserine O-acetyltransferase [Pseudomonadota bacterium]
MSEDIRAAGAISPRTLFWHDDTPFECESHAVVDDLVVAYRTWGSLNDAGDNAVLVCHALTGSADADAWWPGLIRAGGPLDPESDFIICSNVLGGCYGTSGPLHRDAAGRRLGGNFPVVSIRDIVNVQRRLLKSLGIRRLRLVIGPSMGGMQVIEWAVQEPDMVDAIAPIGTSARHSAWCIAIGEAQRAAIAADPNWREGFYEPEQPPRKGLAAARMMAMVTYRSWENFELRFGREPDSTHGFSVASYLQYQGEKLNGRFDAVTYVRLTQAMDSHDVGRGRGSTADVLASITCPALVVSVDSDVLYPPNEQEFIAEHLPNGQMVTLETPHGHDGFLIDLDTLGNAIRRFRQHDVLASDSVSRSA